MSRIINSPDYGAVSPVELKVFRDLDRCFKAKDKHHDYLIEKKQSARCERDDGRMKLNQKKGTEEEVGR